MLSAAESRPDRSLATLRLVLSLESKQQQYPDTLKEYFKKVIKQTVELLDSPSANASSALPEAVSLAVKLSANGELRKVIEEVLEKDQIDSHQAEDVLNRLEVSLDPSVEPSHFSKEIYATI